MIVCKKIMMMCALSATGSLGAMDNKENEREALLVYRLDRATESMKKLRDAARELYVIRWEERKKKEQERAGIAKL